MLISGCNLMSPRMSSEVVKGLSPVVRTPGDFFENKKSQLSSDFSNLKGTVLRRCQWATMSNSPLMVEYHDKEWGVPVHDDRALFEFLALEGAQAGLSWQTVLNKRENYRKAFFAFEPAKIARYSNRDVQRLLRDPGIIRNRLKIEATVNNARQVLQIRKEFNSLDEYIWRFVNGKPIKHAHRSLSEIPATTSESDAMSK